MEELYQEYVTQCEILDIKPVLFDDNWLAHQDQIEAVIDSLNEDY